LVHLLFSFNEERFNSYAIDLSSAKNGFSLLLKKLFTSSRISDAKDNNKITILNGLLHLAKGENIEIILFIYYKKDFCIKILSFA
jgi:hypothetical protein